MGMLASRVASIGVFDEPSGDGVEAATSEGRSPARREWTIQRGLSEGVKRVLPTGIDALDQLLPQGGIGCGQITELIGPRGSGKTSVMLAMVMTAAQRGERVAIVDLEGDLDPVDWSRAGLTQGRVWVVRAPRLDDGLWAADLLLRSGNFGIVVLDGLSAAMRPSMLVRLQRQAKEADAALLLGCVDQPVGALGGVQLRFHALELAWQRGLQGLAEPRQLRVAIELGKGRQLGGSDRQQLTRSLAQLNQDTSLGFSSQVVNPTLVVASFPCPIPRLLKRHVEGPDRRSAPWTERADGHPWPWSFDVTANTPVGAPENAPSRVISLRPVEEDSASPPPRVTRTNRASSRH